MLIYVNAAGERDSNGSKESPFRKINDAARIAQPGDEVRVAPGIYREYVDPVYAGEEQAPIAYIEVSHGPTLIDNNLLLSQASLRLATQGVAVVHNLILGSVTSIGQNTDHPGMDTEPRYTPYHIPHRTEVMGFMTFLHGDDRFYNNIFIQAWEEKDMISPEEENREVGTHVFEGYPTFDEWIGWFEMDKPFVSMREKAKYHFSHLPVWCCGNVYLNGAKAWSHEQKGMVDTEHPVHVSLSQEEDGLVLETDLYDVLGDFTTGIINSDILGYAFEPDQRFENPDGTTIVFDSDFFGTH